MVFSKSNYRLRFFPKLGFFIQGSTFPLSANASNSSMSNLLLHLNHHWQNHRAALGFGVEELADDVANFVFDVGPVDVGVL